MKFSATDGIVYRVTSIELQLQVQRLKKQLAERDAIIADANAKIAKLANEVSKLQTVVKQLLAQRRGGGSIPAGQGVLFPETPAIDAAPASAASSEGDSGDEDSDGADDEDDSPRPPSAASSRTRKPRKIDTTGLPREQRAHDVPEDQRIDPATGKPLVQIGERVFEELDYIRARLVVVVHRQPLYGLPPEEAAHRDAASLSDLPSGTRRPKLQERTGAGHVYRRAETRLWW